MNSIPKNHFARNPDGAEDDLPRATIWMPIFLKDHRAAASTLDHIEHSVLVYLKLLLWEGAGQIPDDDKWIARRVRVTLSKWKAMRDVILADCEVSEGMIGCPITMAEYAKATNNIKQRSEAGKKSGEARRRAAVQRELNGCSNEKPTAVEPRAGGGDGEGAGNGSNGGLRAGSIEEEPFA